ncbi:MAG: hypothetical protein ACFE0J_18370 [Elainellaceae cyanobacterium]
MLSWIVWGSGGDSVDLKVIDHLQCDTCEKVRPFKILLQYRYAHIYWVFACVTEKKYLLVCDVCHRGWELKAKEIEKTFSKHPIPFIRRYGWMFLVFLFVSLIGFAAVASYFESPNSTSNLPTTTTNPPASNSEQSLRPVSTPTYIRPLVTENGYPFPEISGYIDGYPRQAQDGYSSVTVDNSRNDSDVFVKLFSLDAGSPTPAQVFFIRAREEFTVENMRAGNYDIRYRDLDSGALARTDPFDLQEFKDHEGIRYSTITLTLYRVSGGNMQIHTISDQDF